MVTRSCHVATFRDNKDKNRRANAVAHHRTVQYIQYRLDCAAIYVSRNAQHGSQSLRVHFIRPTTPVAPRGRRRAAAPCTIYSISRLEQIAGEYTILCVVCIYIRTLRSLIGADEDWEKLLPIACLVYSVYSI